MTIPLLDPGGSLSAADPILFGQVASATEAGF